MGLIHFIKEFALNPNSIGAIAPSSDFLGSEIVNELGLEQARSVLEYGPGTGALTRHVMATIPRDCTLVAIERNPVFAQQLRAQFPKMTLHEGSVADVRKICDQYGVSSVDCIVSGLPWAAFSLEMQREYLNAMMTVLRPGGRFATFAYLHGLALPAGRRFADLLPEYFVEIKRSRVIWRNVPPAFVYRCRRT
jgi:phospholipid N-methyltransferase